MKRSAFVAAVTAPFALLLAACATAPPLPVDAVAAAGAGMPAWSGGVLDDVCPPQTTCVLGRHSNAADQDAAQRGARLDGFAQLAEQAFPVDVSSRYQALRSGDDTAVTAETRAELMGRLRGARVLDEFWVRRRLHRAAGEFDVYDGWAVVAMETDRLAGLYDAEVRGARREIRSFAARVDAALAAFEAGPGSPPDVVAVRALVTSLTERSAGWQDLPERAAILESAERLVAALDRRLACEWTVTAVDGEARRVAGHARLSLAGAPAAGVPVLLRTAAGAAPTALRSDADGRVPFAVSVRSLVSPSPVELTVDGVPGIGRRHDLPPVAGCVRVRSRVAVAGAGTAELSRDLSARVAALAGTLQTRAGGCPPEAPLVAGEGGAAAPPPPGPPPLDLVVAVTVRVDAPRPLGGRVYQSTAVAEVVVSGHAAGRLLVQESSGPRRLRGVGLTSVQIQRNLADPVGAAVREVIAAAAAAL